MGSTKTLMIATAVVLGILPKDLSASTGSATLVCSWGGTSVYAFAFKGCQFQGSQPPANATVKSLHLQSLPSGSNVNIVELDLAHFGADVTVMFGVYTDGSRVVRDASFPVGFPFQGQSVTGPNWTATITGYPTDLNSAISVQMNIAVNWQAPDPPPLTLACAPTGPTQLGVPYSDHCTASGGKTPYSWSVSTGVLPAGLTMSASGNTASISGQPSAWGRYVYRIRVTDSSTPNSFFSEQLFQGAIAPPRRVFDAQFYVNYYPDLKAAFGTNYEAALNHWLTQGLPVEGRRGSPGFDVKAYLSYYGDLKAAFGTNYEAALGHWLAQGLPVEGRRGSPEFDVKAYLNYYSDLKSAFGKDYLSALNHWLVQGLPVEGRRGSPGFDVKAYLNYYGDLKAAFGSNYEAALIHWGGQGLPVEGRRGSPDFDVQAYLNYYGDLEAAFGKDYASALAHWLLQGLPVEGRRGSPEFDVTVYLNYYGDLKAAFGKDYTSALTHWLVQGLPVEGRRGSAEFDVTFYLNTYPDLKAAFGNDYQAALNHWITTGRAEGRLGVP